MEENMGETSDPEELRPRKDQGEIFTELTFLNKEVSLANKIADELASKLAMVISSQGSDPESEDNAKEVSCETELGTEIRHSRSGVEKIGNVLRELIDRIQL